jgi:hypothetical protein
MRRFGSLFLIAVAAAACSSASGGSSTQAPQVDGVQVMAGFDPGPAPDPSKGFQVVAPIVTNIEPGASLEYCTWTNLILDHDVWVKSATSLQTETGHHVVFFYSLNHKPVASHVCGNDEMAEFKFGSPAGAGAGQMTTSMPGDLAVHVPAGAQIIVNHHYLNASAKTVAQAQSALTVLYADPSQHNVNVGSAVVLDSTMQQPVGPSTLNVDCTFKSEFAAWNLLPHMHAWGTHITVDHTNAAGTHRLFDADWNPDFAFDFNAIQKVQDLSKPYMFEPGDKVHVQCDYMNTTKSSLPFGAEMCLFVAFTIDSNNLGNMACDQGTWGPY